MPKIGFLILEISGSLTSCCLSQQQCSAQKSWKITWCDGKFISLKEQRTKGCSKNSCPILSAFCEQELASSLNPKSFIAGLKVGFSHSSPSGFYQVFTCSRQNLCLESLFFICMKISCIKTSQQLTSLTNTMHFLACTTTFARNYNQGKKRVIRTTTVCEIMPHRIIISLRYCMAFFSSNGSIVLHRVACL